MDDSKIQQIKAVEKQALDIIEEAKQIYQKTLAEAQEKGIASFEEEKSQIKKQSRELLERYRGEGRAEAEKILSELPHQIELVQKQIESGKEKAVEYVISELKR